MAGIIKGVGVFVGPGQKLKDLFAFDTISCPGEVRIALKSSVHLQSKLILAIFVTFQHTSYRFKQCSDIPNMTNIRDDNNQETKISKKKQILQILTTTLDPGPF